MRLALRTLASVVVVLALVVTGVIAAVFLDAEKPANAVGFAKISVRDPQDRPLDVGVWYPTDATPAPSLIGISAQVVAKGAPVAGRRLPLIVISHGNGGLLSSHSDTALALASAGFVAAALTHTGDNAQDDGYVGTPRWLIDRARHVSLLIDYMLEEWPGHEKLDGTRVGVFGFSAGGFTALVSIGGVPDLARITSHCHAQPEFACSLWKPLPSTSVPASAWVHDPRIKAAVVVAPGYGFAFEPGGLSQVSAAVQLWNGTQDQNVPYQTNEAVVRRLLPTPPEFHAVAGAGHFSFLAPCPAWLLPAICAEPGGFDRTAFHREFNRSVIAFYQKQFAAR